VTAPVAVAQAAKERTLLPVVMVLGMLLLIALSVAGYFYYQFRNSAQVADAKEIEELSEAIGAVMMLPEGEAPTLATVTDKDKLSEQPFFQKSENGDKVLIYSNTGRAILYRPSTKKIVDVTTVNVNTPPAETPVVATPEPVAVEEAVPSIARVALFNGSKTVGITNLKEKQLMVAFKNIAVVSKDSAKKNDYTQTIVVDITGKSIELSQQMAESLGGIVAGLPNGETAPADADILVIVGQE
jgi:hypothetical protein